MEWTRITEMDRCSSCTRHKAPERRQRILARCRCPGMGTTLSGRDPRQWPMELRRALFHTLLLEGPFIPLLVLAMLAGFLGHRLILGVVLLAVALVGIAIAWGLFFRRLTAYQREHGLR